MKYIIQAATMQKPASEANMIMINFFRSLAFSFEMNPITTDINNEAINIISKWLFIIFSSPRRYP